MKSSQPVPGKKGRRAARLARLRLLLGAATTIIVAISWYLGQLDFLERLTQDWRQWLFWNRNARPSPDISIVAIDDRSIDTVGRWPWDWERVAAVIDELRRAEASVVAVDILFPNPPRRRVVKLNDPDLLDPTHVQRIEASEFGIIDDEKLLADAIYAHGRVVLASGFKLKARTQLESKEEKTTALDSPLTSSTNHRATLPLHSVISALAKQPTLVDQPDDAILQALAPALLGSASAGSTRGQEFDDLRKLIRSARTLLTKGIESSALPAQLPPGIRPPSWVSSEEPNPPYAPLAESAAKLANVTFDSYDADGLTRRVPLWLEYQGRLWPTLGLAAVLEHKGVSLADVAVSPTQSLISVPGGATTRVPLIRDRLLSAAFVDGFHFVSWPRGRRASESFIETERLNVADIGLDVTKTPLARLARASTAAAAADAREKLRGWALQFYDIPNSRPAEVSAGYCFEPARLAQGLRQNIDQLITFSNYLAAAGVSPKERVADFTAALDKLKSLPTDDRAWWPAMTAIEGRFTPIYDDIYEYLFGDFGIDPSIPDDKRDPAQRQAIQIARDFLAGAPHGLDQVRLAKEQIDSVRHTLFDRLKGNIVFVGWTATGAAADFVSTPIDPKTPGVHVHAAVANALLTERMLTPWSRAADLLVLLLMGALGTIVGVSLGAISSPLALLGILAAWFGFAGGFLWMDRALIAAVGAPTVAAAASWVVVQIHRLFVETIDRRTTEDRFKSYVPPGVVDILVENPELADMKPQKRELTVMFSDVADFTTTAERIGPVVLEKTLGLYLSEMTDVLSKHKATIDKFLGDGIMAFWNAPLPDPDHARNCCKAAVEQLQRLDELNAKDAFGEAGHLYVRIGMSTGECMVGDYGTARKKGYTVLADTANFAARLEGANKFFGSRILAGASTRDVCKDMRWRFLGKVLVKGKKDDEWLYELVGDLQPKADRTPAWIAATEEAVDAYIQGRLDKAEDLFAQLEETFDDKKLAAIYKNSISLWRRRVDFDNAFDGTIQLTEK